MAHKKFKYPFNQRRPIDLICMGRVGVDLISYQIGTSLEDVQKFKKYLGGTPGNVAVGAARLGLKVAMFSRVGTDHMGRYLKKTLEKEGVDTTLLTVTPKYLTGLVILGLNPPNSFPHIFYRENCSDMDIKPDDVDETFFKNCKVLLITGTGLSTPSINSATQQAVYIARKVGTAIVLDIDYRPVLWGLADKGDGENRYIESKSVTLEYQKIIGKTDLIVGTKEEIQIAGGSSNFDLALKNLHKDTEAIIVTKFEASGCSIYQKGFKPIKESSYPTKILNILGAGDAFLAGFLFGWIGEEPLETCAKYGNANSAINISRHGCSEMAYFKELKDIIDKSPNQEK